jgi:transposase
MEACSLDLRKRIVEAVDEGVSRKEVAIRFKVSNALIGKLLRQRRQSGSIAPKGYGGGRKAILDERGLEALRGEVDVKPDATLKELGEKMFVGHGLCASVMSVCRALKKLKLPLKKRRCMRARGTASG